MSKLHDKILGIKPEPEPKPDYQILGLCVPDHIAKEALHLPLDAARAYVWAYSTTDANNIPLHGYCIGSPNKFYAVGSLLSPDTTIEDASRWLTAHLLECWLITGKNGDDVHASIELRDGRYQCDVALKRDPLSEVGKAFLGRLFSRG